VHAPVGVQCRLCRPDSVLLRQDVLLESIGTLPVERPRLGGGGHVRDHRGGDFDHGHSIGGYLLRGRDGAEEARPRNLLYAVQAGAKVVRCRTVARLVVGRVPRHEPPLAAGRGDRAAREKSTQRQQPGRVTCALQQPNLSIGTWGIRGSMEKKLNRLWMHRIPLVCCLKNWHSQLFVFNSEAFTSIV